MIVDQFRIVNLVSPVLNYGRAEILAAYHGPDAFTIVLVECHLLMLTDFLMPSMNGVKLCSRLQENPRACGTMVL